MSGTPVTHETFIAAARAAVIATYPEHAEAIARAKVVYGVGDARTRGVCYPGRWCNGHGPANPDDLVEICASGQESAVQVAGTLVHELGHVLAGCGAGHGAAWRRAAESIGLLRPRAAGQDYSWDSFAPALRSKLEALPMPTDGTPAHLRGNNGTPVSATPSPSPTTKPCGSGAGSRGGRSRGPGSGSRMVKVVCQHEGCGYTVRTTRKWLDVGAPICPVDGHGPMAE